MGPNAGRERVGQRPIEDLIVAIENVTEKVVKAQETALQHAENGITTYNGAQKKIDGLDASLAEATREV